MSDTEKSTEIEEVIQESENGLSGALEIGYLTGAILDYYETAGPQQFDEGEDWKKDTEHDKRQKSTVPEDLDSEIKKAFMFQIKKLQK